MVQFASNGGNTDGYLSLPPSGSGPGVIVIQEWWGLVDHIKDVCDPKGSIDVIFSDPGNAPSRVE